MKTKLGYKCDKCGIRGLAETESLQGWYVAGLFAPMAGGQMSQCFDCYEGRTAYDYDDAAHYEKMRAPRNIEEGRTYAERTAR